MCTSGAERAAPVAVPGCASWCEDSQNIISLLVGGIGPPNWNDLDIDYRFGSHGIMLAIFVLVIPPTRAEMKF